MFEAEISIREFEQVDISTIDKTPQYADGREMMVASVTVRGSRRFLEVIMHTVGDAMTAEESF